MTVLLTDILEQSDHFGFFIYQNEGKIVYANKAFLNLLGYSLEEIIQFNVLDLVTNVDTRTIKNNIQRRLKGEKFAYEYVEISYKSKSGFRKTTISFAYTIEYQGKPAGLVLVFDITPRVILSTLYKSLSYINQVIIQAKNENELLHNICRALHEKTGFPLIVAGSIDKKTKLFIPKFFSGENKWINILKEIKISVDPSIPEGKGTVGRAYRTRQIIALNNIYEDEGMAAWRKFQKKTGAYSVCSVPLFKNNKVVYILVMYSNIPNIFSKAYLSLIKEMQEDISFALDKLEKDREIHILTKTTEESSNWILMTKFDGTITKVNKAVENISGYSREELLGKNPRIFKSGLHNDDFYKKLWLTIKEGKEFRGVFINRKKDGSLFYLDSVIIPVKLNGSVEGFVDIGREITELIESQQKLEKISNFYRLLYELSLLKEKSPSEKKLLEALPMLVAKNMKLSISFVLVKINNHDFKLLSFYTANKKHNNFTIFLKQHLSNLLEYEHPFIKSLLKKKIYIENDVLTRSKSSPISKVFKENNINSCFSVPIIKQKKALGVLVGISEQKNYFDKDMYRLLNRLQSDISYYLNTAETEKWHNIFSNALDSGFDFVVVTDNNFNIIYMNKSALKRSGYTEKEIIGKHHSILSSKTHDKEFSRNFYETLLSGKPFFGVITYKTKNNEFVKAIMHITPYKSSDGNTYYLAVGRDITGKTELQKAIDESLKIDHVTKLSTRLAFLEAINKYIKRAKREKLNGVLIVFNIIKFSNVNVVYGFDTGNKLLRELAKRIKTHTRSYDILGRIHSDKFGVFLENIASENLVINIAYKLLDILSEPYLIDGETIIVAFNAGVSLYPKDATTADKLIEKAEIGLESVKGKEKEIGFFSEEFKNDAIKTSKLKHELLNAISNKEFIVFYQPYMDIKTGKIRGLEALVRWKKNNTIIPPMKFVNILEKANLIQRLEDLILEKVVQTAIKWNKLYPFEIPISVNIFPENFTKKGFANKIINNIKNSGLKPNAINLEIIERALIADVKEATKTLNVLKKNGIKILVDDFGTGYSSLSYISSLPIDFIKIDIEFTKKMMSDFRAKAVVKTIVSLSKDLGLKTIAEGVETKEQLNVLKSLGVDYVQGFYFSKPLPEEEIEKKLNKEFVL